MKKTLLAATALTILMTSGIANAQQDPKTLARDADTITEHNAYQYEYDRDEQCQGYYWGVKQLGLTDTCAKEDKDMNVLNEYVVYFDFDKSSVRAQDMNILKQAANDITKYNPSNIIVVGYTDTRGTPEYNNILSAKRADAVSKKLTGLGVANSVVKEEAKGETNLAVPTTDGTALLENRRVSIKFIR